MGICIGQRTHVFFSLHFYGDNLELQNTDNPVLLSEKEVIEFYRQLIPSYDRCIMGGLYNPLFLTDSIEYFREIIKYEDEEQESITSQKK